MNTASVLSALAAALIGAGGGAAGGIVGGWFAIMVARGQWRRDWAVPEHRDTDEQVQLGLGQA
jgi:phage baseplate assembly protein gpV